MLPNYISLNYVDYRESFNENIDVLQSCVTDNSLYGIYELTDENFLDNQHYHINGYKRELKREVSKTFDLSDNYAEELVFETFGEEINDFLYERDSSTPVKDLFKNTQKFSIFIDTGLEIEQGSWNWTRSVQTGWLKRVKRKLKISTTDWDNDIRLMLRQASFGGQLVVYFYENVDSLITDTNRDKDWRSVSFTDPMIAIIDNFDHGSGDHTHLEGHNFTIPFVRNNLFIDEYFKYSYVSEVCGMDQNWCRGSKAVFSYKKEKGRKCKVSHLAEQALEDKKFAEIYKKGGCSLYDSDMRRHRDVYYINDFPCGYKCPHCRRFWID